MTYNVELTVRVLNATFTLYGLGPVLLAHAGILAVVAAIARIGYHIATWLRGVIE